MINRRNISFLILFMLYLIVFFVGYRYLGKGIFYAAVPMVFGASVLYGYIAGFIVVFLNIPATIFLMYIAGEPFKYAVESLDPFVVLIQCICVVVPGMVKVYIDRKNMRYRKSTDLKISRLQDMIDDENEEKERYAALVEEQKLTIERYKKLLEDKRDRDPLTGLYSRREIIRRAGRHLAVGSDKAYIFVRIDKLKDINAGDGIMAGDEVIRNTGEKIGYLSDEAGRISGGAFLIIMDMLSADAMIKDIKDTTGTELTIRKLFPEKGEGVEDIFKRWMRYD